MASAAAEGAAAFCSCAREEGEKKERKNDQKDRCREHVANRGGHGVSEAIYKVKIFLA